LPETLDQQLARCLWRWARDPNPTLGDERSTQEHIAGLLERFLCDALKYSPEPSLRRWWSDGVSDLRLDRLSDTALRVIGFTWWSAGDAKTQWEAPFEIEFYFPAEQSIDAARTVVRFGWLEKNGKIKRSASSLHPRLRSGGRELQDSAWAVAIELTSRSES
jgi:hypothetical protein